MNKKTDIEKYTAGSILLIILGIVFLILGVMLARTFYGYHFKPINMAMIVVGIFWLIGGIAYGVRVYRAKQAEK